MWLGLARDVIGRGFESGEGFADDRNVALVDEYAGFVVMLPGGCLCVGKERLYCAISPFVCNPAGEVIDADAGEIFYVELGVGHVLSPCWFLPLL
tara:strand:- start:926 stop:1210 length:285 start_codon:yes stop_codon:yes gene_type:complete